MGHETYSTFNRSNSTRNVAYTTAKATGNFDDVFKQTKERKAHNEMVPNEQTMRESRDSAAHPFSIAIIMALDETGSMLDIPKNLIVNGLPTMVGGIIQEGFPDPQILFIGMGDHETDYYPIQVGQFESGDEKMDYWLERVFLEGNGGGNMGESYLLPWYFAGKQTSIDCFEKRGIKGLLFTIGDEPCLPSFTPKTVGRDGSTALAPHQGSITKEQCLKLAQEKYEVYHLHCMQGSAGSRSLDGWKQLLGPNCIEVKDHSQIPSIVKDIVINYYKSVSGGHVPSVTFTKETESTEEPVRKPML